MCPSFHATRKCKFQSSPASVEDAHNCQQLITISHVLDSLLVEVVTNTVTVRCKFVTDALTRCDYCSYPLTPEGPKPTIFKVQ